ncbi:MAG: FAD-dependent monooxygenase [Desulfuromonadales bacterium]|jgi:3-(3-hydroxy-phenyl)propionate hydroxylase
MQYAVIIAGAGPVGLTLANLLGLYGVRTLVLEKDPQSPEGPRAVSLDDESLRIWQQCGLLETMRPFIAEGDEGDVVFTYRSRSGKALFTMTQTGRPYGYARGNVILFHRVLDVLRSGLARFPHVALHTGWTVQDCSSQADRVTLIAIDPQGQTQQLEAHYLVGCDGGRSSIREALQIPMLGSAYAESWLIVDTFDPSQADQPPREGVEVWCDKRCPTASIPLPGGYRRWEFLLRQKISAADAPEDRFIENLIAQRKPEAQGRVVRRLVHTYKGSVAQDYSRERIFLAGDAAHLSPPFAGQGMATGLRDASNLSWKLAYVLMGRAPQELLASYQTERRPHQVRMLKLARRMGAMMMPRTRIQEIVIGLLFSVAGRFRWLRNAMEIRGANITPVYAAPTKKGSSRAGQYLIQPQLAGDRQFDDLLGLNETLITFDRPPREALTAEELAEWQHRGAQFLQVRSDGETSGAFQEFDRWLGDCRQRLLIVRPDRFVAEDRRLASR